MLGCTLNRIFLQDHSLNREQDRQVELKWWLYSPDKKARLWDVLKSSGTRYRKSSTKFQEWSQPRTHALSSSSALPESLCFIPEHKTHKWNKHFREDRLSAPRDSTLLLPTSIFHNVGLRSHREQLPFMSMHSWNAELIPPLAKCTDLLVPLSRHSSTHQLLNNSKCQL